MPDFNDLLSTVNLKPQEPEDLKTFSILVHGLAGTGKSSFASTASKVAEMSPVLYIDFESGTMPLAEWGDLSKITILHITDWQDMVNLYTKVLVPSLRAGEFPYKTVVFDTLDKMQELIVKHFAKVSNQDGYAKWAAAYDAALEVMSLFLNNPAVNFVAITHTSREVNDVTGEVMISPDFEGKKSGRKFPSLFDFVGYMHWVQTDEDTMVPVLTTRDEFTVAKTRISKFPRNLGNPTMQRVYDIISAAIDNTGKADND